jgi:hypothetical protein
MLRFTHHVLTSLLPRGQLLWSLDGSCTAPLAALCFVFKLAVSLFLQSEMLEISEKKRSYLTVLRSLMCCFVQSNNSMTYFSIHIRMILSGAF